MLRLFLFFYLVFHYSSDAALITVETSRGPVQGFDADFGDDRSQTFYGYGQLFLGIPYAKAPLGERRFTLPEDVCRYNERGEAHNATYYRPRCWQVRDILQPADHMDEDCLYLNVYSPNVTGKYPVMFYIPGGTFTTGGGDVYHWKGAVRNLVSRGVVVVTINYRVGVIGFFTTFTEQFPPNRGLYDMIQALKWTNEEIGRFGGDNSRITIFGQSAGASAVSHLSLSPLARGLFHQLIQTSGTALLELETPEPAGGSIHKERAKQICAIDDTDWGSASKDEALMECLVAATPQQIIAYDMTTSKSWMPTIDGAIFPDDPEALAKIRPHYPVIFHDMLEEAASAMPPIALGNINGTGPQTSRVMMHGLWHDKDFKAVDAVSDYATAAFSKGKGLEDDDHLGWAKVLTDIWTGLTFDALFVRDVQTHLQYGNERIWLFTLSHRSLLPFPLEVEDWIPVSHCSDLPYLWYYPAIWETYDASESDIAVADHIGRIWTDFAKNGDLPYDRAGPNSKFIEIDRNLTMRSDWRATTDDVFNVYSQQVLGAWPDLAFSNESWTMLGNLGPRIVDRWNSRTCLETPDTSSTVAAPGEATTSLTSPVTGVIASIFMIAVLFLT